MSTPQRPRDRVSSHGSFLSLPSLFDGVHEGLQHAFKMEISPQVATTEGSGNNSKITFGATLLSDRALLDLGAVDPRAVDLKQVERDCDLLKAAIQQHPEVVLKALQAVCGAGQDIAGIKAAANDLKENRLTEQDAREQGGGFVVAAIAVVAILVLAGCDSCEPTHGPIVRPAEFPQSPGPVDAGPTN